MIRRSRLLQTGFSIGYPALAFAFNPAGLIKDYPVMLTPFQISQERGLKDAG